MLSVYQSISFTSVSEIIIIIIKHIIWNRKSAEGKQAYAPLGVNHL